MATPYVVGMVALLRSAAPGLSVERLGTLITQTAIPLSLPLPNNDSGWGRVDAFAAVALAGQVGVLAGKVGGPNQIPIAQAALIATARRPEGGTGRTTTDAAGNYSLSLAPSVYDVTATAFGYLSATQRNVPVLTGTQQLDFTLLPLPYGTLGGHVTVGGTTDVPTRTVVVRARDTPVTTTVDAAGNYSFRLPVGVYTIEARGLGYRVVTASVTITAGQTTPFDIILTPAPTLLLIDEGAWYYRSQVSYWKAALDALAYTYDEQRIKFPPDETPISATLKQYDIVLWSSPEGSPGLVKGGTALDAYLQSGGRLLLSGQDVAYFDGSGYYGFHPYLLQTIGAGYMVDDAATRRLVGLGPFAGITLTIEGGDGADNQFAPDVIGISGPDKAELVWQYANGGGGGVGTSICTPYRALFLPFGYEAIATRAQRQEVLARSLAWLLTPPPPAALQLTYLSDPLQIGLPGETLTHTLRLRHTGYGGVTTSVTITAASASWPATLTPSTVTLAACTSITLTVVSTIPTASRINVGNILTVTATSPSVAQALSLTLRGKTPAPVLLVDDDRWYPMEARYIAALSARAIPFDIWNTDEDSGGLRRIRSPALDILRRYPLVIWFTGYDWYAPILPQEAATLLSYLDGGGRLLLSSQDFLYYNANTPLASRLGVLHWDESLNPTHAFGVPDHPAGGTWGAVKLDFPFKNWADTVEPLPSVVPVIRGQAGQPLGLAATEAISNSRTLFYAFPLETLLFETRVTALEQGLGWLSPLGTSRWVVTPTVPLDGGRVTSELVLYNDVTRTLPVNVTHTLPLSVTLITATLPLNWHYMPVSRTLTWSGKVQARRPLTFNWAVSVTASAGAQIPLSITLGLPEWGFAFDRATTLHVGGADLWASDWLSPAWATVHTGIPLTLSLALHNAGPGNLSRGTARLWLTQESSPLTATLPYTRGWDITPCWEGNLGVGETRVLTVALRVWNWQTPLRMDAILEDGNGQRWEKRLWLRPEPWQL